MLACFLCFAYSFVPCLTFHRSQARSLLQAVLHPACPSCPCEGAAVAAGYLKQMQKVQLKKTERPRSLAVLRCCFLAAVHPSQPSPLYLVSTALTRLNGGQTHSCIPMK